MRIIPASRDILKIKKRPQKAKGFKNQKKSRQVTRWYTKAGFKPK